MQRKSPTWKLILFIIAIPLLLGVPIYTRAEAAHPGESNRQAPTTGITEVLPVIVSTPRPDGTIVHKVQYGQTLYDIALAYGVSIDYLKGLNYLSNSNIYVGQSLVIQPASTLIPEGSATATITSTPAPTRTRRPTSTATRTPKPTITPEKTMTPTPAASPASPILGGLLSEIDPILVGILGLGLAGVAMMAVGVVIRRKG